MSSRSMETWRVWGVSLAVALLLSFLGWLSISQSVIAQNNQPSDTSDLIQVDATCSLIEAIENANADAQVNADCEAGNGDDNISLPPDSVIHFTTPNNNTDGNNALPVITSNITIFGNDATLVRDDVPTNFRFFNVAAEGSLTLLELRLNNGRAESSGTNQMILSGGAILNQGKLVVNNSTLSNNRANFGGAIFSHPFTGTVTGLLSMADTTFSSNVADIDGGAVYNFGLGTVTRGLMRFNHAGVSGGALVHSSGAMTITGATVQDNTTDGVGGGIAAYAVVADSHIWIRTSTVISNVADSNAGGLYNSAEDGLTSIMQVEGSHIVDNRAPSPTAGQGFGGGVVNGWVQESSGSGVAELQLLQATVADNEAQSGGGVANIDATGFPTRTARVILYQSTLARNLASGAGLDRGVGGGLLNRNGAVSISNSTFSANQAVGDDTAAGGRGGGIASNSRGITTTLQLYNSTIAFNQANQAGGGIAIMGQPTPPPSNMTLGNTLIVSNVLSSSSMAGVAVIAGTESCSLENGDSDSLGGNIEDKTACDLEEPSDQENTSVQLGPLADNLGPTQTHLIAEGGPAFNKGLNAICTAPPVNGVDQRGITRPQFGFCDVGAVELAPGAGARLTTLFPQIYLRHTFSQ